MSRAPAIGIDLGTTFSGAAVYRNGTCEMIPNKDGKRLTPSFVFYHEDSLEVSVGDIADDMGVQKIDNFLFDIKRIIGRKYDDAYVQKLRNSQEYRYKIVRGENDMAVIQVTHNERVLFLTPQQICSEILKYLRESASKYLGVKVTEAVVAVPAHFSNSQRKATQEAVELAGLKVLKLITEPVAAAIHYAENEINKESTMMVFDLGGGTLDVSIIKLEENAFTVKSVEGDTFLGGRDFDQILLEHFRTVIIHKYGLNVFSDYLLKRVKAVCQKLKIILSSHEKALIPLDSIGNERCTFNMSITKPEFEKLIEKPLSKAMDLVEKCLIESGLNKTDISDVVLVGGSTRIPIICKTLESYFNNKKMRFNLNPDEIVALGASIQAALITEKSQHLEKYKITEITPISLGIGMDGDLMAVVIKKNSPLPIKSEPYVSFTSENNQPNSVFRIYEGERKNCKYNNLLGTFTINHLPPGKDGAVSFKTVFSLNEDGILEVESHEVSSGQLNKLVVTIGAFGLCDYKIKHRVEDAELNKHEDTIFENFTRYLWAVRENCNHIKYDLNKIACTTDRSFVEYLCNEFLEVIKTFNYTEIRELKKKYISFRGAVTEVIKNVIDVNWHDFKQNEKQNKLPTGLNSIKMPFVQ